MGKGDRKTAKGKRFNSSYGNTRRHAAPAAVLVAAGPAPVKKTAPAQPPAAPALAAKKAVAKKAVAKKAAAKKAPAAE